MPWPDAIDLARDLALHTAPSSSLEDAMTMVARENPKMSMQEIEEEIINTVAELIESMAGNFWNRN